MAFIFEKMEVYDIMKVEKYTNSKGEKWVRVKFLDKYKTEVIMTEEEFIER